MFSFGQTKIQHKMEHQSNPVDTFITLLFFATIIIGVIAYFVAYRGRVARLKAEYDWALACMDKKKALEAGRLYHAALRRKGRLTIFDEQAITNDLHAIDDARSKFCKGL